MPDRPRPEETLPGHTELVSHAADELLKSRGEASLAAAGLPQTYLPVLRRIVRGAAFVHDLGKCSDHFQEMVRGRRTAPQLVRHEALAMWLCRPGYPLFDWLRPAFENEREYLAALVAACGHHRRFPVDAVADDSSGAGTQLVMLASHADCFETLHVGSKRLDLAPPPILQDVAIIANRRNDPRARIDEWEREAKSAMNDGFIPAVLLAVCKALVLDADVSGSALPRAGEAPIWIERQLSRADPGLRLREIVNRRLQGMPLRPFQEAVATSHAPVTFVKAGCGTGKTIAAYLWASTQHPSRSLWVTYPTTGTATEGFRDYLFGAEIDGRLEHGRAEVDRELLGLQAEDRDGTRERDRLDSIRAWGADVVTCTVDTVLGIVQNQRRGLYAWPSLCRSSLVFDEIHAYDDWLFGCLLRFLEALPGVPVLLMTASLPENRLMLLRKTVERLHGRPLAEIPGPADLEEIPRYRRLDSDDPLAEVKRCLGREGKVLWVSNTVDRCLNTAQQAASLSPIVYHSRFRYRDRVERHSEVIEAFKRPGPSVAVTTQVAEISLDLSADLLITDLAPIPALIQRLGRLNRRITADKPGEPKPFAVLPVGNAAPYEPARIEAARNWLAALSSHGISQNDLSTSWADDKASDDVRVPSAWLDGGFSTEVREVREGSFGITVLMAEDAGKVAGGGVRPEEVAIPMLPPPKALGRWQDWRRIHGYPVALAGAIEYDPRLGARWRA